MQSEFPAANNTKTIRECRRLIHKAKKDNNIIIVLEYEDYNTTLPQLTKLLINYPQAYYVTKSIDNGSKDVSNLIWKRGLKITDITVCGVNSDACVKETSASLAEMGYTINIVKKACNTDCTYFAKEIWKAYPTHPNLRKV